MSQKVKRWTILFIAGDLIIGALVYAVATYRRTPPPKVVPNFAEELKKAKTITTTQGK